MSTEVKFHDDTTATLRDANELTNREMKNLQRTIRSAASAAIKMRDAGYTEEDPASWALAIASLTDEEMDRIDLFQRACVVLRLESWTVKNADGTDRPLPETDDDVDDLPRPIFIPLTVAASNVQLTDDFSPAGAADPKAGTGNSSGSRRRTKTSNS